MKPTNLLDELKRRGDCRYGSGGLRVRFADSDEHHTIRSTDWGPDGNLVVHLGDAESGRVAAAGTLWLLDEWPVVCCEPGAGPVRTLPDRPGLGPKCNGGGPIADRRVNREFVHPLAEAALRIFRDRPEQDKASLGYALAGASLADDKSLGLGVDPNLAYQVVAADVLGCLLDQGQVERDAAGWYRLSERPHTPPTAVLAENGELRA